MKFAVGDRVRLAKGICGTAEAGDEGVVTHVPRHGNWLGVRFERSEHTPHPSRLEKIMPKIDTTKPLVDDCGRTFTFITMTSDGHIMVSPDWKRRVSAWIIFDAEGKFVRSEKDTGKAITLQNKEETKTLYVRVSSLCMHQQTSLSHGEPGGNAVAAIKLTLKDGIVVDAKLARANGSPLRRFQNINGDAVEL